MRGEGGDDSAGEKVGTRMGEQGSEGEAALHGQRNSSKVNMSQILPM